VRVKRNIFEVFTKVVDDIRLASVKDSDDDFQQARVRNDENIKHMKQASANFQGFVNSECSKWPRRLLFALASFLRLCPSSSLQIMS